MRIEDGSDESLIFDSSFNPLFLIPNFYELDAP